MYPTSAFLGGPASPVWAVPALNLGATRPILSMETKSHSCRRLTVMKGFDGITPGIRMSGEQQDEAPSGGGGASRRGQELSRGGLMSSVWTAGLGTMLALVVAGGGDGGGLVAAPARAGGIKDWEVPGVGFKTKSGLSYFDVRPGEGPTPNWGQVTIFHYEAYCRASPDSRLVLFDDTYSRNTPYVHKHGNGRVIRGLDEGLHTMKLGGLRRVIIPLEQGFTKVGLGPLPSNGLRRKILAREIAKAEESVPRGELVYDVELVSVYDDEADLGYYQDLTYDPGFVRQGTIDAMQEMRDRGVKIPSFKEAAMVKPEILTPPVIDESPRTVFRGGSQ